MSTDLKDILEIKARSMATQVMDAQIEAHVKNKRVAGFLGAVAGQAIMGEKPRKRDILGLALTALFARKGTF
jgi:hypothetical protein